MKLVVRRERERDTVEREESKRQQTVRRVIGYDKGAQKRRISQEAKKGGGRGEKVDRPKRSN